MEGPAAAASGDTGARGLPIGRPFGIPVYLSPSWILVAVFITLTIAADADRVVPGIGAGAYVAGVAVAVLLAASVLAHELAHSVVSLVVGIPIRRITLFLLGGYATLDGEPRTPGTEFLIAVAGPLVSLLIGALGWVAYANVPPNTETKLVLYSLALSNTLLAAFNMLPGLPLDGGRLTRAVVWHFTGNQLTGSRVAFRAGQAIATLVSAAGALALLTGDYSGIYLLLVGSFLWGNGRLGLQHAELRSRIPKLSARGLARPALAVPTDLPLSEALRRAADAGTATVLPVDSYGRPAGVLSAAAVDAVPEHRRPWVTVGSLSRPVEPGLLISADLGSDDLLATLRATPAAEYLVTDTGGVVGVLEMRDVAAVMGLTSSRRGRRRR